VAELATEQRAAAPVIGNLLLVAVVIVLGLIVSVVGLGLLEGFGTPTGDAAFEFEQRPAGLEVRPIALGTDVVIELNGEPIEAVGADEAGKPVLVPTAPGDELTVLSQDEQSAVFLRERIDDREQLGNFIAYYPFDGSGSTVDDRSGNGNDGSINGDPVRLESGMRFDGNDDINVSAITTDSDVSEFTVVAAYKQTGAQNDVNQLVEHQYSGGSEWFLETSPNTGEDYSDGYSIDYAVQYPDEVVSSEAVELNERHVVAGTYDGSEYELYVDGEFQGRGTHSEPVETGALRIARDFESNSQYFNGEIYEIRLYYTAFDEAEIERITAVMS